MTLQKRISRVGFAAFFVLAGINHFANPEIYLKIIPPYLPAHEWINPVAGVAEMLGGTLMFWRRSARVGSWLSIATLVAVFPANIYLFQHQELLPASPVAHLLRLPLQGILIYWAYVAGRVEPIGSGPSL
jgi:uncharacterized membrane protein